MKSIGSYERSVFLPSGLNYPKHPIFWESLFCNKINKGLPAQGLEGLKKFLHSTGRKKGSNTGESIPLLQIFIIRWTSLVLPIHGLPCRIRLRLVSTGFGSERFLSPQEHKSKHGHQASAMTMTLPWVCYQGLMISFSKTCSFWLALCKHSFHCLLLHIL